MKKARIVLSALALVAVVGGALAFKTSKFNGQPVYTLTSQYSTFGTLYTRAVSAYVPASPARFITDQGQILTTVYSVTGTTTTAPITFTRVGGTETITFPAWTVSTIANTFTTAVN